MTKGNLTFALHPNREKVLLELDDDVLDLTARMVLDAEALDTVIQELGKVRANMVPAHNRNLDPKPLFRNVSRGTVIHVDKPHAVSREVFLAALHPGFGWLAFPMGLDVAQALAVAIARITAEARGQTPPPLLGPNGKPIA